MVGGWQRPVKRVMDVMAERLEGLDQRARGGAAFAEGAFALASRWGYFNDARETWSMLNVFGPSVHL